MVLFSFPLCIVDCVIFCENSTNWSFFWPPLFFFCCYLPLIDMNKQLQDIFISVSPSFFLCTCFLQIDEKSTHWKTNNELVHFEKKRWIMSCWKKWSIAIKNFDNFLYTYYSFFSLFLFFMHFCLSNFHFLYGFMNVLTLKVQYNAVLLQYN